MDATTTSVKPPIPRRCGHCFEPICEHAIGWLDGLNAALTEARAEIATKDARIAELEAFATEQNRERTEAIGACQERIAQLEAENEALRADVVWAVTNGADFTDQPNEFSWWQDDEDKLIHIECDGTDADILRAVREARER